MVTTVSGQLSYQSLPAVPMQPHQVLSAAALDAVEQVSSSDVCSLMMERTPEEGGGADLWVQVGGS